MRILVMGLSGSGKTTLSNWLVLHLAVAHINADAVREMYQDWDFSDEGRIRQAKRIDVLANIAGKDIVVMDFIAALPTQREIVKPDFTVWMNTIPSCKYADTNAAFVPPLKCEVQFNSFEEVDVQRVLDAIKETQAWTQTFSPA